jgi:hypothetical protein
MDPILRRPVRPCKPLQVLSAAETVSVEKIHGRQTMLAARKSDKLRSNHEMTAIERPAHQRLFVWLIDIGYCLA